MISVFVIVLCKTDKTHFQIVQSLRDFREKIYQDLKETQPGNRIGQAKRNQNWSTEKQNPFYIIPNANEAAFQLLDEFCSIN